MKLNFAETLLVMILTYATLLSIPLLMHTLDILNWLTFGIWLAVALASARRMKKRVKDRLDR